MTRLQKFNANRERLLRASLKKDLHDIGLPVEEVKLSLRPFSKTYYGRYFPSIDKDIKPTVYIYPYCNDKGVMYGYDTVLYHSIHEMCHHLESSMPFWKRYKGVMHDPLFWKLFYHYIEKAQDSGILREEEVSGVSEKEVMWFVGQGS